MADYMGGLLAPGHFAPGLPPNLLAMLARPGQPAANMAGNMLAAQAPQGSPQAPAAPPPPATPSPLPAMPAGRGVTGAAPTDNALLAGGIAAMRAARPEGGGSLGAALGEGLASGSLAFTATKDAEADVAARVAAQETYARRINGLVREGVLDRTTAEGLIGMGVEAGSEILAKHGVALAEERNKVHNVSEGAQLRRGTGELIAENVKPDEPFDIAKMSTQMRDAFQLVLRRNPRDPDSFGAPLTEDEAQQINAWIEAQDTRRAPRTSVSVNSGERGAMNTMWTQAAGQLTAEYNDEIRQIPERIEIFDSVLQSIDSGNYFSGSLADLRRQAASFGNLIGMPVDLDKVTNSQTLLSELRNAALRRLPELDSRPTDKDMEILIQAVGDMSLTPEALRTVFQRARERAVGTVGRYRRRVEAFERDFEGTEFRVPSYLKEVQIPASPTQQALGDKYGVSLIERR